jgi:hypothetical protein
LAVVAAIALLARALPIDHPVLLLVLSPPFLGGLVAIFRSTDLRALVGALALIIAGGYLVLIAWAGLVYAPAVVVLVYAIWSVSRRPTV